MQPPEWCSAAIPSIYSYIQRRYWGVGLLRFYRDPRRVRQCGGEGRDRLSPQPDACRQRPGAAILAFHSAPSPRAATPTQLPMVALSLPVAYLSLRGIWAWLAADWLRAATGGLWHRGQAPPWALVQLAGWMPAPAACALLGPDGGCGGGSGVDARGRRRSARLAAAGASPRRRRQQQQAEQGGYLSTAAAPYVYHWAFSTVVALLVMNVNVATR